MEKQVMGFFRMALDAKDGSSLVHIQSHFLLFVFSLSLADPLVFLSRQFVNMYINVFTLSTSKNPTESNCRFLMYLFNLQLKKKNKKRNTNFSKHMNDVLLKQHNDQGHFHLKKQKLKFNRP